MNREEVLKLAKLARIDISDTEAESLSHEFAAILKYVGEVKGAAGEAAASSAPTHRNVMREDGDAHESGIYTDRILAEAPASAKGYVKVKKIL